MVLAPISFVNYKSANLDVPSKLVTPVLKSKKTVKYNWLNLFVWFVALPAGALLWIGFMTWLLYIIF